METDAHRGHTRTHKDISGGDAHTRAQTHTQRDARTRTCPHAVRLYGFYQEKCCSGDESLCTLCFLYPPSVVRQQPLEARTMATASAAPTMRSRSRDITTGAVLAGTFRCGEAAVRQALWSARRQRPVLLCNLLCALYSGGTSACPSIHPSSVCLLGRAAASAINKSNMGLGLKMKEM